MKGALFKQTPTEHATIVRDTCSGLFLLFIFEEKTFMILTPDDKDFMNFYHIYIFKKIRNSLKTVLCLQPHSVHLSITRTTWFMDESFAKEPLIKFSVYNLQMLIIR